MPQKTSKKRNTKQCLGNYLIKVGTALRPVSTFQFSGGRWGSNPRPSEPQSDVLTDWTTSTVSGVQIKAKISISQNFKFIFSCWSQLLSLDSSERNELSCTISNPFNCYQGLCVKDLFRFEKNTINRQYIRAATLPVDEAGYILHCQYCINKEFSFHTGYRAMGNVYVYQRSPDIFLGYGNNSVSSSSIP